MSAEQGGISALILGGLSAALGGILTGMLQIVGRRSESRATAAELVTRAASSLVDRLEKENADLRQRLDDAEHREG